MLPMTIKRIRRFFSPCELTPSSMASKHTSSLVSNHNSSKEGSGWVEKIFFFIISKSDIIDPSQSDVAGLCEELSAWKL